MEFLADIKKVESNLIFEKKSFKAFYIFSWILLPLLSLSFMISYGFDYFASDVDASAFWQNIVDLFNNWLGWWLLACTIFGLSNLINAKRALAGKHWASRPTSLILMFAFALVMTTGFWTVMSFPSYDFDDAGRNTILGSLEILGAFLVSPIFVFILVGRQNVKAVDVNKFNLKVNLIVTPSLIALMIFFPGLVFPYSALDDLNNKALETTLIIVNILIILSSSYVAIWGAAYRYNKIVFKKFNKLLLKEMAFNGIISN